MKISCMGGAGYYFCGPIADLAAHKEIHGSEIVIYDVDHDRSELMAAMGRRLSRKAGARLKFKVARKVSEAVAGSDFVLSSIGGIGGSGKGGYYASPVHINDKLICGKYGVPQVVGDTAGPAAMMAAFRSIPIHLEICRQMERHAPEAVLVNHANPMAALCRAMTKYSGIRAIGICHGVQEGICHVARVFDIEPEELETTWIGTNHYYWFTSMRYRGEDFLPRFWKRVGQTRPDPRHEMCFELAKIYGHWLVYSHDDHVIEFYPYLSQATDPCNLPYSLSEHGYGSWMRKLYGGEQTIEDVRRADRCESREAMLKEYEKSLAGVKVPKAPTLPLHGEATVRLIADMAAGRRNVYVCNVPNQGAVSNLPAETIIEVEAVTDSTGVRPICTGTAPLPLEVQLRRWAAWQELVVDAAVKGDRKLALQAMQVDACAVTPDKAKKMLSELIANSKGMLPTFERKRRKK